MDYSHEVKPASSAWKRNLLIVAGSISFALGILGIFLPLLPTTPFLLLTATCYAKASPKFYNWLMNHSVFGPYIHDFRSKQGIPRRTKIKAISMILLCFTISSFFIPLLPVKIAFFAVGVGVIAYLLKLPTRE